MNTNENENREFKDKLFSIDDLIDWEHLKFLVKQYNMNRENMRKRNRQNRNKKGF